jgi:hypothetical protein
MSTGPPEIFTTTHRADSVLCYLRRSSEAIFGPGVPTIAKSFRFSRNDEFKVECNNATKMLE